MYVVPLMLPLGRSRFCLGLRQTYQACKYGRWFDFGKPAFYTLGVLAAAPDNEDWPYALDHLDASRALPLARRALRGGHPAPRAVGRWLGGHVGDGQAAALLVGT